MYLPELIDYLKAILVEDGPIEVRLTDGTHLIPLTEITLYIAKDHTRILALGMLPLQDPPPQTILCRVWNPVQMQWEYWSFEGELVGWYEPPRTPQEDDTALALYEARLPVGVQIWDTQNHAATYPVP